MTEITRQEAIDWLIAMIRKEQENMMDGVQWFYGSPRAEMQKRLDRANAAMQIMQEITP